MNLRPISPQAYARDVLPLTASLWAGHRDFEQYAAQTLEIANSKYGKQFYQTAGLFEGTRLLASCKRYERTLHLAADPLKAIGIGAVFTPEAQRGSGYATAMLAMLMDEARASGHDVAYLFSDIHPAFYAQLGFKECPSRAISVRADSLAASRVSVAAVETADWTGIRRCFDIAEKFRNWGFLRSPLVWDWIRMRLRQGSEHGRGQLTNLVVRKGKYVIAYVIGERDVAHDAFVVDEFGFADLEGRGRMPALLRSAAADLRRIVGWLPPQGARDVLPRGSVRKRKDAILMMAPLSPLGKKLVDHASVSAADGVWSSDHI